MKRNRKVPAPAAQELMTEKRIVISQGREGLIYSTEIITKASLALS